MVRYSKDTYGSQFSEEKNGLEIRFLKPEIFNKYKRSIFLRRPVFCLLMLNTVLYNCTLRHKPWSRKNDWLAAFCFFIEKMKIENKNNKTQVESVQLGKTLDLNL